MILCVSCVQKFATPEKPAIIVRRCDMCKKHNVKTVEVFSNKLIPLRIDAKMIAFINQPLYDHEASDAEKDAFDKRCEDLFALGFKWDCGGGSFYLNDVYSLYWEQVNNAKSPADWESHIKSIKNAINRKKP